MRVRLSRDVESRQLALSLSLYCLISAEAAVCGHRQHAEPSTTAAQRLQGPRTRSEPKNEKNKRVSMRRSSLLHRRVPHIISGFDGGRVHLQTRIEYYYTPVTALACPALKGRF